MSISRRRFLADSAAAAAALSAGSYLGSQAWAADTADIRVAVIGIRNQGNGHIKSLGQNVVALCDVNARNLDEAAKRYPSAERFIDFRDLYDHPNRFDAAVVELFGDVQSGDASTRLDGAIVIDRHSGVLLRLDLRSAQPRFQLQRRLVRVDAAS